MLLEQILLWGRDLDEYRLMFNLTDDELKKRIVSVADGPATFNAELAERGINIVSADPIYDRPHHEIEAEFLSTLDDFEQKMRLQADNWQWGLFDNPQAFVDKGRRVFKQFLADYQNRGDQSCYVPAVLPSLPFQRNQFELALCSNLLFAYTHLLSLDFHVRAIRDLARVANEVRIFPLNDVRFERSEFVDPVLDTLLKEGYQAELQATDYYDHAEHNYLLRIWH